MQNTIQTGGILHKIEVSGQLWLEKGRGNFLKDEWKQ